MTRKDYILIAKAINDTKTRINATANEGQSLTKSHDADMQLRGVRRVAAHLADALAADNPMFDPQRFLTACGYGATGMPTNEELERGQDQTDCEELERGYGIGRRRA